MEIKIVIGSNYGDEGKGMASRYFVQKSKGKCLTVLHNGGAQRGHTIDYDDDKRFIYHHRGCGTLDGSDTYFDKQFIVNPIIFAQETIELKNMTNNEYRVFSSPECRVTTPYDMILNQMVEKFRGIDNEHGSCGFGIFETIKRYENAEFARNLSEMEKMSDDQLIDYLNDISKVYLKNKINEYGISKNIVDEYLPMITSWSLLQDFIVKFRFMIKQVEINNLFSIVKANNYETIIYEGAQGLALDMDNKFDYPYLTPSKTGSIYPLNSIMDNKLYDFIHFDKSITKNQIELCYVTRTYFTRHGAGPFPTECNKDEINSDIEDKTNVPNPYQKTIRYGKFDKQAFLERVNNDEKKFSFPHIKSCFCTHLNYSRIIDEKSICLAFDKVYYSDNKFGVNIYEKSRQI